jgi:hypothetical protein
VTLSKALPVAQKIKELNGGNPWSPDNIATAIDVGSKSSRSTQRDSVDEAPSSAEHIHEVTVVI